MFHVPCSMSKLFLLRHLKSQWNQDNRFAGWVDNPLSEEGKLEARLIAEKLLYLYNSKFSMDVIYTSPLIRNKETVLRIFDHIEGKYPLFFHLNGGQMRKWGNFEGGGNYVPVYVSESLNERYYGRLQGLDKAEIIQKYGEELVRKWRRSYNDAPPWGESLKDVYRRSVSFFKKYVEKDLKQKKNILIVASHNSLRALVKYIENISDDDIANVELAFGELVQYEFDDNLKLKSKN